MTKQEVIEKVNAFLIEDFEIEQERLIAGGRIKEDVGIDSLDIVDIVVEIHDIFGVKLDQTEIRQISTLDQFYDLIVSKVNG